VSKACAIQLCRSSQFNITPKPHRGRTTLNTISNDLLSWWRRESRV